MIDQSMQAEDPFDLARFVLAQNNSFELALSEIQNGHKLSHWMWYIFPQLRGLGSSTMSHHYGITGINEASAYLAHDILGPRLLQIYQDTLAIEGKSAPEIFGRPDDMKLRSSATLFAQISHPNSVFHQTIDQYFSGTMDERTIQLLTDH